VDAVSESKSLRTDAERLREYLLQRDGHDYDLTDEQLAEKAQEAREWIGGRRWSWTIVAYNAIRDGRPHA
jgi:hypothetical protein